MTVCWRQCDRRRPPSIEIFCCAVLRTGTVSQAAGSAYIEVGATKAMAAVYGPRPTDRREAFSEEGQLGVDVKLASFATRTRGRITQVQRLLTFMESSLVT
jgi:ribonuclease PH